MTQSLQSILSEREKLLRENFEVEGGYLDHEKLDDLLSFHAETARLVAEAVQKPLDKKEINALMKVLDEGMPDGQAQRNFLAKIYHKLAALRETN